MNRKLHRLVFSRRLGDWLPVAEHARSCAKSGTGARALARGAAGACAALVAAVGPAVQAQTAPARPPVVFAGKLPAPANNLPVMNSNPGRSFAYDPARGDPRRGGSSPDLLASGRVSWTVGDTPRSRVFDQGSEARVVVNWDSFDIGPGYSVHFKQDKDPTRYVSALNRIWSADPSVILGSLTADREVILLNANGVYFGRGARVDTGKFVATANSIADSVFEKGLRNVTNGSAVFSTSGTDYVSTNLDAAVSVEAGAEIRTAAGGDVLLVAPRVVNQGRIETPKGQAVLAAGDRVYLMSSSDPAQRGLIVAVDPVKLANGVDNDPTLGSVENAARGSYKTVGGATVDDATPDTTSGLVTRLNEIRAESGTVNLVGLAVRQGGQVNATTAVKGANGAIYLQAMGATAALAAGPATRARGLVVEAGSQVRVGSGGGTLALGGDSVTAVRPSQSGETQLDAEVFNPSLVRGEGAAIHVAAGARVVAPSGRIELLASGRPLESPIFDTSVNSTTPRPADPDGSRVIVDPGAMLNVAGLAGVPIDGSRNQGTQRLFRIELADSPVQRAGPLYRNQVYFDLRDASKIAVANVSGAAAAIGRTAAERSTRGGSIRIESDGVTAVRDGARIDVSGGSVEFGAARIESSLLERDGRAINFRSAAAGAGYERISGERRETLVPAYAEGADGGTLSVSGRALALEGDVTATTLVGPRQRDGSSARPQPATLAIGRQALGSFYLDGIRLEPGAVPPLASSLFGDPFAAEAPVLPTTTTVSLEALARSGVGALNLRAGSIAQAQFGTIDLGIGGRLDLRADRVSLDGVFSLPGGTLSIVTANADTGSATSGLGDITLSGRTRLELAGLWTNDTPAVAGAAPAVAVQINGGSASLNAANSLLLQPGAVVDVSGGARLAADGSLSRGTAGTIALTIGRSELFDTRLAIDGASLRGIDFGSGGRLTLAPRATTLGDVPSAGRLAIGPQLLSAGGFGSIVVDAFGSIDVAPDTVLKPTLSNWQLAPSYRNAPSGRMSAAVVVAAPVDESVAERRPVNLTLNAVRARQSDVIGADSSIEIPNGSGIRLQPGGALTLSATGNIAIAADPARAGTTSPIEAPGGQIRIGIVGVRGSAASPTEDPIGFSPTQAIWIGQGARISVAGVAKLRSERGAAADTVVRFGPAATPPHRRVTGTVFGGGSIAIAAQRGYVVVDRGSRLELDGAAAELNVPGIAGPVLVARAAGSLSIRSPEGIVLDGQVSARAPRDAAGRVVGDGGRLDIAVGLGGVNVQTSASPYPGSVANATPKPRQLRVDAYQGLVAASGASSGGNLLGAFDNGIAFVPETLLTDSGFERLRLGAGDLVRFGRSVSLEAPLGLVLDAPAVGAAPGATIRLAGSYVSLGDRSPARRGAAPDRAARPDASPSRDTTLTVAARAIEFVGSSALQGFSAASFDAGGDAGGEIRLTAVAPQQINTPGLTVGQLAFAGGMQLVAAQTYATSGTSFTIAGLAAASPADPGSTLELRTGADRAAAAAAPLSAFGSLNVTATRIDHQGVLWQPFGAIGIRAERELVLGDSSVTSVSGRGTSLLYGTTENLSTWLRPGGNVSETLPVGKGVTLSATRLVTSPKARIDASGGGEVRAWEFFSGVGGSRDYLLSPDLFAVLPDYARQPASPIDGGVAAPGSEFGRELVVTMPGSGLPVGSYTLLPARYALLGDKLPRGAFVVRRATDQGRAALSAPLFQDDGSVVVAGHLRELGSSHLGAPAERFVVESPAEFLSRSEYRLTALSDLLAGSASDRGAAAPTLPRDAGTFSLTVTGTERSLWQAGIRLDGAGARAGNLDVSATRVALVDDLARTPDGALGIASEVISVSGAGSVLLGGTRRLEGVDQGVAVYAVDSSRTRSVTVSPGSAPLAVEELIVAASESVDVAAGANIEASRAGTLGQRRFATVGDGALLAVSANPVEVTRRSATLAAGALRVGPGARLAGPHVDLDATDGLAIERDATLQAGDLALAGRRLVLGDAPAADARDTVISGDLLASVRRTPAVTLRSYTSIDFVGAQDWAGPPAASTSAPEPQPTNVLSSLVVDAPLVRGLADSAGMARTDIAARSISLLNSSGRVAPSVAPGSGTLSLLADPVAQYGRTGGLSIGPGSLAIGFDAALLQSRGDIVLAGLGGLSAQRDLILRSARLTAASGTEQTIAATAGILAVEADVAGRSLGERVGQGAQVQLAARSYRQDGRIDLPGGALGISATGTAAGDAAIEFSSGALASTAGASRTGGEGFEVFGPAGSIALGAAVGRIEMLGTLDAGAARRADGTLGVGDGGSISLTATGTGGSLVLTRTAANGPVRSGALAAAAGAGGADRGGRLQVDVTQMTSADPLARAAAAGGLTREFTLRVRNGDLAVGSDVRADRIFIAADQGALTVEAATLGAAAPSGGVVQLASGSNLALGSGARIDARSTAAGTNGGDVLLSSRSGRVSLAAGAVIDARGDDAADGRIVLRALRAPDGTSVRVDRLETANLRAGEVDVEAVRVYSDVTFSNQTRQISTIAANNALGTLGQATVRADSAAFMAGARAIESSLGITAADRGRVQLRAGVEIRTSTSLAIAADWNLLADRPGGDAGFLTLRAAGDLNVSNGSISDGFASAASNAALGDNLRSWSYRLAAGADLNAAHPLAVSDRSSEIADTDTGNLRIASGRSVRTGAGSIELAAGRDVVFGAGSSTTAPGSVYVAGRKTADLSSVVNLLFGSPQVNPKPVFTETGGRVELVAERDVRASSEATQLIGNWLLRLGIESTTRGEEGLYTAASQLAWWTDFSRFRQTVGSFGGGQVEVRAGRDVRNLQVMAASSAWADSRNMATARVRVRGGAGIDVVAGRDLLGGQFLSSRGASVLEAGRSVGAEIANTGATTPILAQLGESSWRVRARSGVSVLGSFNATALPVEVARAPLSGFYYTWGDSSSLELTASTGSVSLLAGISSAALTRYALPSANETPDYFRVLPSTLRMTALDGDVNLVSGDALGAVLYPSRRGQLELWAGEDIRLGQSTSSIAMADSDSRWPVVSRPVRSVAGVLVGSGGLVRLTLAADEQERRSLHLGDSEPVRLHAESDLASGGQTAVLLLPKPARLSAGRDIIDLRLVGQNLQAGDYTSIVAGRNVDAGQFGLLELGGPGALEVRAGADVNFGASAGIVTRGNQRNPNLPSTGASVVVSAARGVLDLARFESTLLRPAEEGGSPRWQRHRDELLEFVKRSVAVPPADYERALELFRSFPADAQTLFGRRVIAAEFGAVYLDAAPVTTASMTESLRSGFERRKVDVLQAGAEALATGAAVLLPGKESLQGAELAAYLEELRALQFSRLELDAVVRARVDSLNRVREGWRRAVASGLGSTPEALDALAATNPLDSRVADWRRGLAARNGRTFDAFRESAPLADSADAAANASLFGRRSLPIRLALFDQGFQALELAGLGSFVPQVIWPGVESVLPGTGRLELTQSGIVTERGGDITLLNPGGGISVGLKEATGAAKGVIALGGGNIVGVSRDDFQVNTQRVFIVGSGDMSIWTTRGDIDSGRGANTAVGAPPLVARRTADGVVFEVPATTTGSGLGILEDAQGRRSGTIGLYPAFGEILALDAFIRAPTVLLGAVARGADNIVGGSVGGAAAAVSAPPLAVASPPTSTDSSRPASSAERTSEEPRPRSSLLTVELLGIGSAPVRDDCTELDERQGRCTRRTRNCTDEQKSAGECR